MTNTPRSLAIIGAGMAGLRLGQLMQAAGWQVQIFEKSRGLGGRMATRTAQVNGQNFAFDHGAVFFTIRDDNFRAYCAPLLASGQIAAWDQTPVRLTQEGTIAKQLPPEASCGTRYVPVPTMNSLVKPLATNLAVKLQTEIAPLTTRSPQGWSLTDQHGTQHGPFAWVVSTAPAPQTARLMPPSFVGQAALAQVKMGGCYALLLGFADLPDLGWPQAQVQGGVLRRIVQNHRKPGRPDHCLMLHADNDWATQQLDADQTMVEATLLQALQQLTGVDGHQAAYKALHRWRYANVLTPAPADFLLDENLGLAATGDWCRQGRLEAAWLAASALAARLLQA